MRIAQLMAIGTTLCSRFTSIIALQARQDSAPRVLSLDVEKQKVVDPVHSDRLRRRDKTVQASLENEETLYFVNVSLGTPAQKVRLHIDTGSSDLWVNTPSSSECALTACSYASTYTANKSSTYVYLNSNFSITYDDSSGASGDFVEDTVSIGGSTLTSQQFGVGYTSTSIEGILGVGYQINEAANTLYENVPAHMVTEGLISSNAFSLWLNDLDSSTGSILFGGVDTDKFSGTLATLPVQKDQNLYAYFLVTLTGVSCGSTSVASDQAIAVVLDSGTSLTYLPDSITEAIYEAVGAEYDSGYGAAFVDCSLRSSKDTFNFTFSDPVISIPMDEMVLDISQGSSSAATFENGEQACLFGIAPAGTSTAVLGDTFLRSAYVVYDLRNNEISIAQTRFNVNSSNILEITNGTNGVPSATLVATAATATTGTDGGSMAATVTLDAAGPTGTSISTSKSGAMQTEMPVGPLVATIGVMVYAVLQ